jgi:hypothetical protein
VGRYSVLRTEYSEYVVQLPKRGKHDSATVMCTKSSFDYLSSSQTAAVKRQEYMEADIVQIMYDILAASTPYHHHVLHASLV